jgi:methylated-DNA-[protein]-cysteine S-methyltransferase
MLREYFDGSRRSFDGLPLRPVGTDFQMRAWDALLKIPFGETRSYKEQAAATGNDKASRAVGAANGKNPISIIIPCPRVIGADGSLIGFGGGLDVKKYLLDLERKS